MGGIHEHRRLRVVFREFPEAHLEPTRPHPTESTSGKKRNKKSEWESQNVHHGQASRTTHRSVMRTGEDVSLLVSDFGDEMILVRLPSVQKHSRRHFVREHEAGKPNETRSQQRQQHRKKKKQKGKEKKKTSEGRPQRINDHDRCHVDAKPTHCRELQRGGLDLPAPRGL